MIEVSNLVKRYGDITAVNDISFKVEKGEIVGFLGPNGAGKTTTMRILTGFIPATGGKTTIGGYDVAEQPLEVKKRLGYLPEHPPLYPDMTVVSYLKFISKIKDIPRNLREERIDWVIERCGLKEVRSRVIANLSKGYKQRIGLAQAIIHKPEVLIFDEPTIGLDPKQIKEIRELIKELAGEHTVILSTHILPEVTMTCQKAIIINNGKLVAQGSIASLTAAGKSLEEVFIDLVTKEEQAEIQA